MKKIFSIVLILLLIISLISCGSSNESMENVAVDEYKADMAYGAPALDVNEEDFGATEMSDDAMKNTAAPTGTSNNNVIDQRKIIKSANMEIETLEFDKSINLLQSKINAYGGYIESSNVRGTSYYNDRSTRHANYTLRIPVNEFSNFMMDMNTVGNIINKGTFGSDITSQYFDTDAHLKALKIQEERLLDILRKAEIIEDVITLERELSNVRYEIESLSGTLRRWDNLVDYATLNISIYEVYEITEEVIHPKTLSERISAKFKKSTEAIKDFFENSAVFAIGTIPFLIFWVPGLIIFYIVVKKIRKSINVKQYMPSKDKEIDKK